jgi:hypothetical protein
LVPNVPVLSPLPPIVNTTVFLGIIAVIVVLIGIYVIFRLRKHIKIIAAVAVIVAVLVGGVGAVLYSEASIEYWFVAAQTQRHKTIP